jgi:hypothetical protein
VFHARGGQAAGDRDGALIRFCAGHVIRRRRRSLSAASSSDIHHPVCAGGGGGGEGTIVDSWSQRGSQRPNFGINSSFQSHPDPSAGTSRDNGERAILHSTASFADPANLTCRRHATATSYIPCTYMQQSAASAPRSWDQTCQLACRACACTSSPTSGQQPRGALPAPVTGGHRHHDY